ncbi:hypothetical protein RB195_019493 [Necator americanus]|uniref:Uncharacterized protein n=1 Tax=Necator americanus TaxID=51031 RepID=A0ABR1CG39_NECAM
MEELLAPARPVRRSTGVKVNFGHLVMKRVAYGGLSTYRFFVHTWSLAVELQYYLIAPVLMGIASCCEQNTRRILFFCLAAFSIVFQLLSPPKLRIFYAKTKCSAVSNKSNIGGRILINW